jgi:hypothetical protein
MDGDLMLDERERLCEGVGKLFDTRDVLYIERIFLVVVPNKVVPYLDVLRPLVIWFTFDDGFGSFIISVKDGKW